MAEPIITAASPVEQRVLEDLGTRYEILGELGRGGMGVAYHGRDRHLHRDVALKILRPTESMAPEAIERFRREARMVAGLHHPGITQVYDFGEAAGCPYMVMQLAGGSDLDGIIKERSLLPREAAELVRQIAEALQYAHDQGVLHRDIKPGNIKVLRRDDRLTAMLLDFGLGIYHGDALPLHDGSVRQSRYRLTNAGQILGTPVYMSPEQIRGAEEVDGRADVYALGVTLYEILTGTPPFVRPTLADLLDSILLDDPVPIRKANRGMDADLETISLKCLQKEAANRYGSARELADDLRRFLAEEPIQARPVSFPVRWWRRARRQPAMAVMGAILVFLVAGATLAMFAHAALRHAEFVRCRDQASQALDAGDLSLALVAARQAELVDPSDAEVRALIWRIRAQESADYGEQAYFKYLELKQRVELLRQQAREERRNLEGAATHAKKARMWQAESALRSAEQEQEDRFANAISAFTEALSYWKDHPTARRRLADLHWDRYLDAERRRDRQDQEAARLLVLKFGHTEYAARLRGDREVRVAFRVPRDWRPVDRPGEKPGCPAWLFRYVAYGAPPVLLPVAADPDTGDPVAEPRPGPTDPASLAVVLYGAGAGDALASVRSTTAFPIPTTDASRLWLPLAPSTGNVPLLLFHARLPRGSFLLLFPEGVGLVPVRYPFEVSRDSDWEEVCDLPGSADLPPMPPGCDAPGGPGAWWRFVPAGAFTAGGDSAAQQSPPREGGMLRLPPVEGSGEGYFISAFEVTGGMYLRYLNDRTWQSANAAFARIPRTSPAATQETAWWRLDDSGTVNYDREGWRDDWPVFGISYADAADYAKWLSQRSGDPWVISLPSEAEWEKAARGADGRYFPWGDAFDRSFCRMQDSRSHELAHLRPEPYGLFLLDESPYGVRDLAGGIVEWTSTVGGPDAGWHILKGSSWSGSEAACRAASRLAAAPEQVHGNPGFRLVAHRAR